MKKRLDMIMMEHELAPSRTQAQALIMAGQVSADGKILDKPGVMYDEAIDLHLKYQPLYVSRAGDKLASVAGPLELDFTGKTLLDVGSSTGGFTDFVLQNGAAKAYCVDVGTAQLAYKLRQDPRVILMEQTDIRDVRPELATPLAKSPARPGLETSSKQPDSRPGLVPLADIAVIDVSFISLTKIMASVAALVKPGAPIVAMAKPQFEAGKPVADRYHGVIPMGQPRDEILAELKSWLEEAFIVDGEADSGLAGAEGNVEHFFKLRAK